MKKSQLAYLDLPFVHRGVQQGHLEGGRLVALGALLWRFGVPAWRGEVRHVVCFSVVVHMLGVLVLWDNREESNQQCSTQWNAWGLFFTR